MLKQEFRDEVSLRLRIAFLGWKHDEENRTQQAFSKLIGVKKRTLWSWLTGKTLPNMEQLHDICDICNCSAEWILCLTDERRIK